MEENKFEKQVKRKMDELKLQPSEDLWGKIASRIEKKKRSRWGLILLMLLGCIVLSGGYWLWNTVPQRTAENNNPVKNNSAKNISKKLKEKKKDRGESEIAPVLTPANKNDDAMVADDERINSNKKFIQHPKSSTAFTTKLFMKSTKETSVVIAEKGNSVAVTDEENAIEKGVAKLQNIEKEEPGIDEPIDYPKGKITADTLSISLIKNINAKPGDTMTQKNSAAKAKKTTTRHRWKTGILFSGGLSNVGNDFLDINNSSFYLYDPAQNNSTSGGSPQGSVYYPSNVVRSFGFMAGMFEEKRISPKTKISVGVNFTSFATTSKIGKVNDTTGFFNSRNPLNNFTAHYDFIELPILLTVQIGKGKNIPFFWQVGLSVAELLHTNALQFNPGTGYYYRDNSIFNKTQIGLHTSLSIELFSKQNHSILVGPYISYHASRIANKGLYTKKHFVYTGLRAAIIFGK